MTTLDRDAMRAELRRDEGTGPMAKGRYFPYRCPAGKLTIGCGRNLDDAGISAATETQMLDEDIDACLADLQTFPWFLTLDPVRVRAVVNLRFNLGAGTFRTFRLFVEAMSRKDYAAAGTELRRSNWARQVKDRAARVIAMIETGAA